MDAKLKSLKVVELRDILAKASAPAPAKANKQDLINKIIASPAAIQIYNQQYPSAQPKKTPAVPISDDLLAPPEDVDWAAEDNDVPTPTPTPAPAQQVKPPSKQPPASSSPSTAPPAAAEKPPSAKASSTVAPTDAPAVVDDELAKRKARAERFGVPLVEPKKLRQPQAKKGAPPQAKTNSTAASDRHSDIFQQDPEKLKARAARFGTSKPANEPSPKSGQKRAAPVEEVDPEEQEKRRKRAERFGIPVAIRFLAS
ncbi:hypothetical protein BV22DRAFT_1106669 [Leucogyrophana mollusca]|uniref:Uncharacterized protein n=1 Tax=Leucogyrophana mollusca TaxID=85980 RepID=A0ACB8BC02_9AGAM|nr:hypothetical protein BV22DRAFT_1106669 [Leucogyrophana mollusca]